MSAQERSPEFRQTHLHLVSSPQENKKQKLVGWADFVTISRPIIDILANKININSETEVDKIPLKYRKLIYSSLKLFAASLDMVDGIIAKKTGGSLIGDINDAVSDHFGAQATFTKASNEGILPREYGYLMGVRDGYIDGYRIATRLSGNENSELNVVRMDRMQGESKKKADKLEDTMYQAEKTMVGILTPYSPFFTEVFANTALMHSIQRGLKFYNNSGMKEDVKKIGNKIGGKLVNLFKNPHYGPGRKLD